LAAIGVDRLRGTANVVLRALPELAPAERFVAGASLDAEGNPQLVLDADGLVDEAAGKVGAETEESSAAPPVLVIDDSLTTRMLERSILESAGYLVDVAVSAEEALESARRKKYSLFLVDVEMPGMDGFTFIERIRADAELRHIPAILVTSLSSPESLKRGEEVGAQGYMIKSEFDQAQLLALIKRLAA
jgi:two-component system chemotaxis sensor kinase CheA